jgi:mono/diheme cytochrome c family protein
LAAAAAPVRSLAPVLLTVCVVLPACGGRPGREAGSASRALAATLLRSDAERSGQAVFRGENCGRCHTLFDAPRSGRPEDLPSPGRAPLPSRVGPDLGLEGHRHSDDWHLAHLYAPSALAPGTPMPAARHLFRPGPDGHPEPTGGALALVSYLQALGRAGRDVWSEFRRAEPEIPDPPASGDLAGQGDRLYSEHCAGCHGEAGDGRGPAAPLLSPPPRDLVAGHYRFRSTPPGASPGDSDLFRAITLGGGTGSAMPAFYWLPAADRWALVLRIKEFSARLRGTGLHAARRSGGTASVPGRGGAERGSPAEGRRQWIALGCPACHGEDAAGRSRARAGAEWTDPAGVPIPGSGDLRHACSFRGGASDEAILGSIERGVGTAMPAFGEVLDRGRGSALLLFLRSLDADITSPGTRSPP